MKILNSLSEEHALKLNENLVDWLSLEPDFVNSVIGQALQYENYPIKIIQCECGNVLPCNFEIFNQAVKKVKEPSTCSCIKYSSYLIYHICNQDEFNKSISEILRLEKLEHNSDNFRSTALGILPPSYGLYPVVNFNLDILLWAIYSYPGTHLRKEYIAQKEIESFYSLRLVIRELIFKCKKNNFLELDKLLQWWNENHHPVIHKRLNIARIGLESSTSATTSLFSEDEVYIKHLLTAYTDYYEIHQFLEIIFNLIKISNGENFVDAPFKGEKTILNGQSSPCRDIAPYCAKLKEYGIQELNNALDKAYNNKLRNKTGGHNYYDINNDKSITLIETGEIISFNIIDEFLTSVMDFQRSIMLELGAVFFFDLQENMQIHQKQINTLLKNQQVQAISNFDANKYNLPTYGILNIRIENTELPIVEFIQFWSHAFLDPNMESFQKVKIMDNKLTEIPSLKHPVWISFSNLSMFPGDFVTEMTPILQTLKNNLKNLKQLKLIRNIVAPNHPFFATMGVPVEIDSIKMVGLGVQEKIIDIN